MKGVIMKNKLWIIIFVLVCAAFVFVGILRKGTAKTIRHIAVIPKGTTHVFWQSIHAGAEKAAKEYGNVTIYWNGPEREGDREKEIQIVEDFIVRHVDAVVLAPIDDKSLVPPVEKLYEAGIPCIIIDSGIDTEKYVSFVATDNYQGGVLAAQRMGEILGGTGRVIVVKYMPGGASTTERENGFFDTIAKDFPNIKIIDNKYGMDTVETALQAVEDLLTKNPQFEGIYACNESTTTGTLRALQGRGLAGKVKFVGFDSSTLLIAGLRSGEINALVVQNPFKMGYDGVRIALDVLDGKKAPRKVDTGVKVVTVDNIEKPEIKELLGIK